MGWYRLDLSGARAVFTDRRGGSSRPPYAELNLSSEQGDEPAAVAHNRAAAGRFVGVAPEEWVPIRQVHGTTAVFDDGERTPRDADAVVVTRPGRAGLVLTADCAPLALGAPGGVAAVHGGWRGLLDGVIGSAVDALTGAGGAPRVAVLGPCIRACCYEFGDDDLVAVAERFGPQVRGTTTDGRPALDVPAVVRAALHEAGVQRLLELPLCTGCSPDYFSHRRDAPGDGITGRQGLLVARPA